MCTVCSFMCWPWHFIVVLGAKALYIFSQPAFLFLNICFPMICKWKKNNGAPIVYLPCLLLQSFHRNGLWDCFGSLYQRIITFYHLLISFLFITLVDEAMSVYSGHFYVRDSNYTQGYIYATNCLINSASRWAHKQ